MAGAPVVEQRLTLHELLRVGLARQEDLRLLQSVVQQEPELPVHAAQQLVKECQLREEFRCSRESRLLEVLKGAQLASLAPAPQSTQLLDQLQALQQVQEELRKVRMRPQRRATKGGHAGGAQGAARPQAPSSMQNSTAATHSSLGAALKLYAGAAVTARPVPRPNSSGHAPGPQLLSGPGKGSTSSKGLRPTTARSPSPFSSKQQNSPMPQLLTAEQLRRQLSGGRFSEPSSPVLSKGPPGAKPQHLPSGRGNGPGAAGPHSPHSPVVGTPPGSRGSARPQNSTAAQPRPGSGGGLGVAAATQKQQQQQADKKKQQEEDASKFKTLLRLQGTLMQGLIEHLASDGAAGAYAAMAQSTQQMQEHFASCIREAREELVAGSNTARLSQSGSLAGYSRPRNWDRLLQLGQLGLTGSDLVRLQQLRRQQAARTIQRVARVWLKKLFHIKAIEIAQRRAAKAALKLRNRAATIIQQFWRGYLGRKVAKRLRAERVRQQRERGLVELKRCLAAIRIQRAWRKWAKKQRVRRMLNGAGGPASPSRPSPLSPSASGGAEDGGWGGPKSPAVAAGSGQAAARMQGASSSAARASVGEELRGKEALAAWESGLRFGGGPGVYPKAGPGKAGRSGKGGGGSRGPGPPPTPEEQFAAAVRIQAAVRGWLARRSKDLWWKRSAREMRQRRAAARVWAGNREFVVASYGLQEQLLASLFQLADAEAKAARGMAAEKAQMEDAWGRWLSAQAAAALSQPLPKGWIPCPDPNTGQPCFLDTKSGALHAHHPTMLQLKAFATTQRAAVEAQMAEKEAQLAGQLQALRAHSMREQSGLLGSMLRPFVESALGKPEQQGPGKP